MAVIDSLFNTLFRCSHRRTTFPLTQARKAGADASEIYVVCLDCGKQFVYDWEHMRIAKPVDIAVTPPSAGAEGPRIPFKTKRALRYLAWASAVSAAWAVGRAVKSRRRSSVTETHTPSSDLEAQTPSETSAQSFQAEIHASGSVVARVIRGKREPTTLAIDVQDSVSLAEQRVLRSPSETTDGIRVADDRISSADDLYPDGTVEFSVTGRPAQGEESVLPVCNILREHLNRSAEIWEEAAQPQGREEGVDGELRHRASGTVLKIQVVRAEVSPELRRKVAQEGSAGGVLTSDLLADALQLAIDHKRTRAYPYIVLALDATETSRFAFTPVVASFRRRHGKWAKRVGFKEIWVVGPIPDLVERLDIQE